MQSYGAATFALTANVKVDPAYETKKVRSAVKSALTAACSFASRDFGQQVTLDGLYAVIQSVAGVIAADIQGGFYRVVPTPVRPCRSRSRA